MKERHLSDFGLTTIKDFARNHGVHYRIVHYWVRKNRIPYVRITGPSAFGRVVLLDEKKAIEFLETRKEIPNSGEVELSNYGLCTISELANVRKKLRKTVCHWVRSGELTRVSVTSPESECRLVLLDLEQAISYAPRKPGRPKKTTQPQTRVTK
jgi:predicted site-specific integrase-resolvase